MIRDSVKSLLAGNRMIPEKLRVSIGTAAVLGLDECRLDVKPTTAYLMTYTEGRCIANCAFCPQARESSSKKSMLSRVLWPVFHSEEVLQALGQKAEGDLFRVCIQAINYPGFYHDVLSLLNGFRDATELPVSLDSPPLDRVEMEWLREAGLDRISIPLDAATPELFDHVKGKFTRGPYIWENHFKALSTAVEIFGKGKVMSNLIIGLGEKEREAVELIQQLRDMSIPTVLYAFTPIHGTTLASKPQPPLTSYRRVQLARYLITHRLTHMKEIEFDDKGKIKGFGSDTGAIRIALRKGDAFRTSGCPGCNRPFYNERPSGPIYNYPTELTMEEAEKEVAMFGLTEHE